MFTARADRRVLSLAYSVAYTVHPKSGAPNRLVPSCLCVPQWQTPPTPRVSGDRGQFLKFRPTRLDH